MPTPPDGRAGIDVALVRELLAEQFPELAHLPVRPVEAEGWDNRTYRLGDELTVRLPTADGYVPGVAKEDRWLPVLAPHLPVPIPEPVRTGRPSPRFDRPWSVRRWLPGRTASSVTVPDRVAFADQLAGFLTALQRVDVTDGPIAGEHSFFRGCPPAHYDAETRRFLDRLTGHIDVTAATEIWEQALASPWRGAPVWFHGDVAWGNLLVADGRLSAVIDFGTCGVGDPACDLVIAWTFFSGTARAAFRAGVEADAAMWARARGWAVWKSMLILAESLDDDPDRAAGEQRLIADVIDDHRRS